MCKHVAATLYGVGARLDERPDLLFLLPSVDHNDIVHAVADRLGTAPAEDVRRAPSVDLREAMALAAHRDSIARQYRDGYDALFDLGLPTLGVGFSLMANSANDAPDAGTVVYLAYLDGSPIARATGSFSEHGVTLFGGATLPEARGRGAYRALVHARWHDAVERGTRLAVTDAGSQSRPILASLGFREVCTIRALIDRLT